MDTIQATINQMHSQKKDDDLFIEDITKLATNEGDRVYQTLLQFLTSLDLPSSTAHDYWQQAVSHRDQMTRMLGRKVSLITALGDYLHHHREDEYTPYLIDAKSYQQIVQESVKDRLTGLNNRAYFDQVFEQQLSLAQRYNTDLSLLFLDLDNFKDINDRYGHQAGDFVLQSVAAMIEKEKRDSDIAIRYGGEEFILLMPHTGSINGIILAERIRQSIACTVLNYNNNAISITISGGLASYPTDGDISSDILAVADQGLYQAKGAGKNIISIFKEDKRRYLRVKFYNPVYVKVLEIDAIPTYAGRGKDICIGGILFQNSEPLEIGSRIQIHTQLHKENRLLLIGTVIRVEAFGPDDYDIGVAISFKEMEKIAREEIAGLLRAEK
jgi:diguanylate cyclase (GGDEF)-like protein